MSLVLDRNGRRPLSERSRHSLARYMGATDTQSPRSWTRLADGLAASGATRNTGVMWSRQWAPGTRRASAFSTDWRQRSSLSMMPYSSELKLLSPSLLRVYGTSSFHISSELDRNGRWPLSERRRQSSARYMGATDVLAPRSWTWLADGLAASGSDVILNTNTYILTQIAVFHMFTN